MTSTFGKSAFDFFSNLRPAFKLPKGIEFLLPYEDKYTCNLTKSFYKKYFNDKRKRIFIIGINPGRFGAGLTGIAFTDPVCLEENCGINNKLDKRAELSSIFIYQMIQNMGGPGEFYKNFLLTSVCPIGFVKYGKNINYYDDKGLLTASEGFIKDTILQQVKFGAVREVAFCLGEGKNLDYLNILNSKLKLFDQIIGLPHPRYIMQYKRKKLGYYHKQYLDILTSVLNNQRAHLT
jgi:hypothetical protein